MFLTGIAKNNLARFKMLAVQAKTKIDSLIDLKFYTANIGTIVDKKIRNLKTAIIKINIF